MHENQDHPKYDPGVFTPPKVPNNSRAGQYWGARFGYANGPLDVATSYGEATIADNYFAGSVPFVSGGTFQARASRGYDLGIRHAF